MIKTLFKHISKYYKDTFVLAIAGVAVGVLVGLVDAAFGLGLNACTAIRTKYFWYLIWFLPLGGVFIWFIYHQFGKSVANGMKMVFHVGLGKNTTTTTEQTTTTKQTTTTTTTQTTTTTAKQTTTTQTTTSSTPTEPTAIYGDINLDGRVDITDAVLLNKACAGTVMLDSTAKKNADCNGDGEIGSDDAVVLLKFLVHLVNTLPFSE